MYPTQRTRDRYRTALTLTVATLATVAAVAGGVLTAAPATSEPADHATSTGHTATITAAPAPAPSPAPGRHRPPCKYEDGGPNLPCYWDATKRGNGKGRSYWIDRAERVHYVTDAHPATPASSHR